MRKALIVATIGGFLPVTEINNANLLQELGYELHYAANMKNKVYDFDEEKLRDKGIQIHQVAFSKNPFNFKCLLDSVREVREIIECEHIEVIHCHTPVAGVVARIAAWIVGGNVKRPYIIYTAHGFHFYKGSSILNWILYYPVEYLLSFVTDCLITINKEDYELACKMHAKKVVRIPGVGIDLRRFRPIENVKKEARSIQDADKRNFHIVSVGELNENKNHSTVIKAIDSLKDTDIIYEIYGNGPLKEDLEELIKELRLEKQVFIRGFEIKIEHKIANADCFIFPSFREGLGLAALEAMACGIPLIASDNRGTREYMQHNINGIVCKPDDVKGFAYAIKCMKDDQTFSKRVAEAGLQTVTEFSLEKSREIMRTVYETV